MRDSSYYNNGKVPSRLFVALVIAILLFDDVVASYTSRNSEEKRDKKFHVDTSSLLSGIGEQRKKYNILFEVLLSFY